MREYEFNCEKCNTVWYATDKDIKESKNIKKGISIAKMSKFGLHMSSTYNRYNEQIAQMKVAHKDYERCPSCGSRQITKIETEEIKDKLQQTDSTLTKLLTVLAIIFMPYIGFFAIVIKRPFKPKTNVISAIYCIVISYLLIAFAFSTPKIDKTVNGGNTEQFLQNRTTVGNNDKESKKEKEPFYKTTIESKIEKLYEEGLDFSAINYTQLDPMESNLYNCKNTFTGKLTKKKHEYLARVGYDNEANTSTVFYISIDGKIILWDENGENKFVAKK